MASGRCNLGGVEVCDVRLDGLWGLGLEVDIVNGELVVEPLDLAADLVFRDPGTSLDQPLD